MLSGTTLPDGWREAFVYVPLAQNTAEAVCIRLTPNLYNVNVFAGFYRTAESYGALTAGVNANNVVSIKVWRNGSLISGLIPKLIEYR